MQILAVRTAAIRLSALAAAFVEELCQGGAIEPGTLEIAQLAGRIEGEQAAEGIVIALPDLMIGATASHLGCSVATLNLRDFRKIADLSVTEL